MPIQNAQTRCPEKTGRADRNWFASFIRFLRDDDGPTSVEYCVMLGMILLVIIGTLTLFGQGQAGFWGDIDGEMKAHGV